jgi:hypothetical protein
VRGAGFGAHDGSHRTATCEYPSNSEIAWTNTEPAWLPDRQAQHGIAADPPRPKVQFTERFSPFGHVV